jgi:hypothetical protein
MQLVREAADDPMPAAHCIALARQLGRWRFWRRGVASEILRFMGRGKAAA